MQVSGGHMIVPTQATFGSLASGTVFTSDGVNYCMKTDATDYVNLSTGQVAGGTAAALVTYFPNAKVSLG